MTSANASQEAAIHSASSNCLVISGPGSGKTSTLVSRIVRLIDDGVDPANIVALTFTQNAAREIKTRVEDRFMSLAIRLGFAGTLHSFLLRLIQEHHQTFGYPSPRLAVLDESQADDLLNRCAKDINCKSSFKKLKEAAVSGEGEDKELLTIKRFTKVQRENGIITYDGILTVGLRLINGGLELPFQHLMLDEFQDVSDIDAAIYEALPIPNKFLVGDPDQSIYGWRGSRVDFILEKAREIELTGKGELIRLEENYRSDRSICAAAQRLIEHNENRVEKVTRTVSDEEGSVQVIQYANPDEEKLDIRHLIRGSVSSGQSVAVLLRTNILVDEWKANLKSAGIAVASRSRSERPADWPLAKAALAVLNDPENDWLVYSLIRLKDGEETANGIKLAAEAQGVTINATTLHIPQNLSPTRYGQFLLQIGVSQASHAIVETALAALPPESTGTELMAELAETEHSAEEIGAGVWVGTMHGAKGKEFDTVFLPAFEQQIIPATKTGKDLEEMRRLAYVAFTRARHRLIISHCAERTPDFGGFKPVVANPSQFLHEGGLI